MKWPLFLLFFLLTFIKVSAQQTSSVDFTHLQALVRPFPSEKMVSGELVYSFDVLKPIDSIKLDARKMDFQEVLLNGQKVNFSNDGKNLWLTGNFSKSKDNQLLIRYTAHPKQAMYFINYGKDGSDLQMWTQGQGKYTSHWMPSFDDTSEKVEFDLSIDYKAGKEVIANGVLKNVKKLNDSVLRWEFDMDKPMSSYLIALAAGDFGKKDTVSKRGISMSFYFPPKRGDRLEPTYRYSTQIMDFFEKEMGVNYPWQNYKQVPVRDFLYSGMENTGTTIFSDILMVDSTGYNDRNYVNVNAHELAHQWFGDYVTAASGQHHWLQEGFATYYALLAEKEIFGEDYFYWKLFQTAEQLKELSDSGNGEAVMSTGASSITYYQKGAWALHILKERVGKEAFDLAVKNYLQKNAFGNVKTEDFISEVEKTSGSDLTNFVNGWLRQAAFQGTEALESLKKSEFIRNYLEVAALKQMPLENKKEPLKKALRFPVNDYVGQEVVHQLALEEPLAVLNLYKKAFETNNLYVRQAIALSLEEIPVQLKSNYESLLNDESYVTQEAALYHLWWNFPKDRMRYLSKMANSEGFLDKNIRTLWLALNIATPEVELAQKKEFLKELKGYTSENERFQVRQNAFQMLFQISVMDVDVLKNLLQARHHHNYRFREFAKEGLKTVLETGAVSEEGRLLLEKELNLQQE
ncbi:MAG: M1 family aminopeptidase [Salinimicrobium sp.]